MYKWIYIVHKFLEMIIYWHEIEENVARCVQSSVAWKALTDVSSPPSGGYDHVPVDSMQGLDIGSQHGGPGSNYGPIDPRDLPPGHPGHPDLTFDQQAPPQPPRDNNQMAAWYDTDL